MVLTEKGYNRPTYSDILDEQIERAKVPFGEDIDDEKTPLGKYIRINAQDIAELRRFWKRCIMPDFRTAQPDRALIAYCHLPESHEIKRLTQNIKSNSRNLRGNNPGVF